MRRLLTIGIFLTFTGVALARLSVQEWTLTYFKSDCDRQCLKWMPADADSAKVHFAFDLSTGDTASDTTIYR
jgi:hypothetical protein